MCPTIIQNLCFKNYSPCKIHSLDIPQFWLFKNVKLFHLFIIFKTYRSKTFLTIFYIKIYLVLDFRSMQYYVCVFPFQI